MADTRRKMYRRLRAALPDGASTGRAAAANSCFASALHDEDEKSVLGHKINAGGMKDGEAVIEILTRHPSTARFISTKLVRRFVSDDPPQSLVKRVADVYTKTSGDIREMLRTMFTSSEFYADDAAGAKMKTPLEFVASAIRALDGETDGSRQLAQIIARMGQPLYQCRPPTGFPDRADHWASNAAVVERLNFAVALTANRIPGTTVGAVREAQARQRAASGDDRPTGQRPAPQSLVMMLGSPEFQKR